MDVTPLIRRDAKIIQSYKDGVFKISGEVFTKPVAVMADRILQSPITDISKLQVTDFSFLADLSVEVVLFGTGEKQILLPAALRSAIKNAYGFMVESMDNGAASRTYNALMAEGRQVAVILIP